MYIYIYISSHPFFGGGPGVWMGWDGLLDGMGGVTVLTFCFPAQCPSKDPKAPNKRNKTGMSMILSKWILTPDK